MTLDEQIEILENNAEFERKDGDLNSCLNFRQLAEWLKDYKRLKEQKPCKVNIVPEDDAISREEALMALTGEWTESRDEILSLGMKRIKVLPSVQPRSKTGHWIEKQKADDCEPFIVWECSNCHNTVLRGQFRKYGYCPNCGSYNGGGK